ncbi:Thoeris anti-defense Tad2 family protein [Xenorhabdus szentirmaii]|uniref:Thoeris anti-defense Tad2 family protein n=1 Tax=Xenorhabdus szentirmaii TaxID=290112 RepID=UPI00199A089E|nr:MULTISPECIES: MW1434 family type I TA system toxin [unclassified Xenorhabdus]MBD2793462.1 DUF2829 domain-containing protein [Xenorhabdus sp. CUL]MBD2826253.1 DUF2829 domain-containing protein [Xenorhabdus sp. 5]
MSEVNKPENKKMGYECQIKPDDYKIKAKVELSNSITAPVGSFPWAIIQLYLGNQRYRKDWDSPMQYLYLKPQSSAEQTYMQVHDKHGHWKDWKPDQEDMVSC